MKNNRNEWRKLWGRKGLGQAAPTLNRLIEVVGWVDHAGNVLTSDDWLEFMGGLRRELGLQPTDVVLDIGCGAGALLLPLYLEGYRVVGIDYSESLVQACRAAMPNATVLNAEASSLPFEDSSFDVVISNSIFQYFESERYARAAFGEIARCVRLGGRGAILDLNDSSKRQALMSERYRRYGGREAYNELNVHLPHQFYNKRWVLDVGHAHGLVGRVADQHVPNYCNNAFRFNYFFRRQGVQ